MINQVLFDYVALQRAQQKLNEDLADNLKKIEYAANHNILKPGGIYVVNGAVLRIAEFDSSDPVIQMLSETVHLVELPDFSEDVLCER